MAAVRTMAATRPTAAITFANCDGVFSRAKVKNRKRIETAANRGKIDVRLSSQVKSIGSDAVELESKGGAREVLANDAVIVCAGGVLPTAFLKSIGIRMETKHGTL
jgi:thioredoxin reductase (NADPH)